MKQLMVVIFMVSFIIGAEHHKGGELNAEQIQQAQEQAGPVGAALEEIKSVLRQPKTLTLLASIAALHLIPSYVELCPEAVFMMGLAKYMALTPVCLAVGAYVQSYGYEIFALPILVGMFWYQYSAIFWGIQEWAIERSGGKYRGIIGNLGTAAAERTLIYFGWKKP